MGRIGVMELLVILVIALVIFGGKKLRTLSSDLGAAVRDFKKAMDSGETEAQQKPLRQIGAEDAEFHATEKQGSKPEQTPKA